MRTMLLDAIRAQPDDELARLAYADQLEEAGQADRARLVRVQTEQHRLGEGHPQANRLAQEAEGLLAQHERAWLGPWADRLVRWTFTRGALDKVTLEPEVFIAHGEELFAEHPVREVRFVGRDGRACGPEAVEELVAHPALRHVRAIDAAGSAPAAGPTWARALAEGGPFPRLEELDFSAEWRHGASFTDLEALEALCQTDHLPALRRLELDRSPHDSWGPGDELVEAITGSPLAGRLTHLGLSAVPLSEAGVRRLAGCKALRNLEWLGLGWCEHLPAASLRDLFQARQFRRLKGLELGGDIPIDDLARSPLLATVERLYLSTNATRYVRQVPPVSWRLLGESAHVGRVRRLSLMYQLINPEGLSLLFGPESRLRPHVLRVMGQTGVPLELPEVFVSSPALRDLTGLEVAGCELSTGGVARLLDAPFIGQLALFCIAGSRLTARGAQAMMRSPLAGGALADVHLHHSQLAPGTLRRLLGWRGMANVTHLEVDAAGLDEAAARALHESPHLRRLTALNASGRLSDAAALALAAGGGLPRLRYLNVDAPLGEAGEAALRARFGARLIVGD